MLYTLCSLRSGRAVDARRKGLAPGSRYTTGLLDSEVTALFRERTQDLTLVYQNLEDGKDKAYIRRRIEQLARGVGRVMLVAEQYPTVRRKHRPPTPYPITVHQNSPAAPDSPDYECWLEQRWCSPFPITKSAPPTPSHHPYSPDGNGEGPSTPSYRPDDPEGIGEGPSTPSYRPAMFSWENIQTKRLPAEPAPPGTDTMETQSSFGSSPGMDDDDIICLLHKYLPPTQPN